MKELPVRDPVTGDTVAALVDDDVYEWASQYTWRLQRRKVGRPYVQRTAQEGHGYTTRRVFHSYLHREVLGLSPGDGVHVDHRDHNTLDNRRANLRATTRVGNMRNRAGAQTNSATGVRGVTWSKGRQRYYARVWVNGKRIFVGSSKSLEEAGRMAAEGRRLHYGEDL